MLALGWTHTSLRCHHSNAFTTTIVIREENTESSAPKAHVFWNTDAWIRLWHTASNTQQEELQELLNRPLYFTRASRAQQYKQKGTTAWNIWEQSVLVYSGPLNKPHTYPLSLLSLFHSLRIASPMQNLSDQTLPSSGADFVPFRSASTSSSSSSSSSILPDARSTAPSLASHQQSLVQMLYAFAKDVRQSAPWTHPQTGIVSYWGKSCNTATARAFLESCATTVQGSDASASWTWYTDWSSPATNLSYGPAWNEPRSHRSKQDKQFANVRIPPIRLFPFAETKDVSSDRHEEKNRHTSSSSSSSSLMDVGVSGVWLHADVGLGIRVACIACVQHDWAIHRLPHRLRTWHPVLKRTLSPAALVVVSSEVDRVHWKQRIRRWWSGMGHKPSASSSSSSSSEVRNTSSSSNTTVVWFDPQTTTPSELVHAAFVLVLPHHLCSMLETIQFRWCFCDADSLLPHVFADVYVLLETKNKQLSPLQMLEAVRARIRTPWNGPGHAIEWLAETYRGRGRRTHRTLRATREQSMHKDWLFESSNVVSICMQALARHATCVLTHHTPGVDWCSQAPLLVHTASMQWTSYERNLLQHGPSLEDTLFASSVRMCRAHQNRRRRRSEWPPPFVAFVEEAILDDPTISGTWKTALQSHVSWICMQEEEEEDTSADPLPPPRCWFQRVYTPSPNKEEEDLYAPEWSQPRTLSQEPIGIRCMEEFGPVCGWITWLLGEEHPSLLVYLSAEQIRWKPLLLDWCIRVLDISLVRLWDDSQENQDETFLLLSSVGEHDETCTEGKEEKEQECRPHILPTAVCFLEHRREEEEEDGRLEQDARISISCTTLASPSCAPVAWSRALSRIYTIGQSKCVSVYRCFFF